MAYFKFPNGQTLRSWCKENNVSYPTVYKWVENGMLMNEACAKGIELRDAPDKKTNYVYGKTILEMFGGSTSKSYSRLMSRIRTGTPIDKAVEDEVQKGCTALQALEEIKKMVKEELEYDPEYDFLLEVDKIIDNVFKREHTKK